MIIFSILVTDVYERTNCRHEFQSTEQSNNDRIRDSQEFAKFVQWGDLWLPIEFIRFFPQCELRVIDKHYYTNTPCSMRLNWCCFEWRAQKSIAYAYIGNDSCIVQRHNNNNNGDQKLSAETFHKFRLENFEGCVTQVAEMCCLKMKSNSPILCCSCVTNFVVVVSRIGRFNWGPFLLDGEWYIQL